MTEEPEARPSKVYFLKLGTGEDLFAHIKNVNHPTMLTLENPMIIEPIDYQGGRQMLMTRYLPYVDGPLKLKESHVCVCQEASDLMSQYYQATLEYQTKEGGDERFTKGVQRAVDASKNETPARVKEFNDRLLWSSLAVLTDTKN